GRGVPARLQRGPAVAGRTAPPPVAGPGRTRAADHQPPSRPADPAASRPASSVPPVRRSVASDFLTPEEDQTMKFGIFYEHQLPRPWDADAEHRLLKDALD